MNHPGNLCRYRGFVIQKCRYREVDLYIENKCDSLKSRIEGSTLPPRTSRCSENDRENIWLEINMK